LALTDEQRLNELGYKQELNRTWSSFSNFAISFSIISILAGCFTTFAQAWNNGGPVAISIGWPLISLFILIIGFQHTTGIFHHFSHSNTYTDQILIIYLHMHIPLAITPILLLTWHPPVVTGIVHLGPRLSVNCSPLFPIAPSRPPLQNPNPSLDFPEPNVHLIKARLNPLPSIQNSPPLGRANYYLHITNWCS